MNERIASAKIKQVRQQVLFRRLLADALLSAFIALLVVGLALLFFHISMWWTPVCLAALFTLFALMHAPWSVSDSSIVSFLDANYPQLEESASLTLRSIDSLNLLERIQLEKLEAGLMEIEIKYPYLEKQLKINGSLLILGLVMLLGAANLNFHHTLSVQRTQNIKAHLDHRPPEHLLPQIETVQLVIAPPAYTGMSKREQDKLTIEAEQGSAIRWMLKTNVAVKKITLLFNDSESVSMRSDADQTRWVADKIITQPGFYQVVIDGKLSDLYQVLVIKDVPPVIHIIAPKQYTYIDAGEKQQIAIRATAADDYGVTDAFIYATIAKGSGEAVKFKEQKISFPIAFGDHQKKYDLSKLIDLHTLNMEPGDELYFYVQAADNHQQQSRSDVYIVSIQDTAQLLNMDGIASGVNIKPEYFRSERQIILDSERLLKEKDTISAESFKNRSNELGTDQKLLRLRYGKFLGDEADDGADPQSPGKEHPADPKDFGNGDKIRDQYTDKHDNAEDAQFFDPTVKAQLKATLTEMWKAELQLRLYKPQDALPFEYKALRLLKDLQQKSRSYVAKTAYNPTPLKMEKRLTGDLNKIIQPVDQQDVHNATDQYDALKNSVAVLEQIKTTKTLNATNYRILQLANLQLSANAAAQPGAYLRAVSAMRNILNGNKQGLATNAASVEAAIQKLLPNGTATPQKQSLSPDMGLSEQYYHKLTQFNR